MSAERGFTLLELVVALAIAALAIAIVLPNAVHRPGRAEVVAAAHGVASSLRMARSRAIASNRPTDFIADADRGVYRDTEESAERRLPPGTSLTIITTLKQAEGPVGAIRFFPDGSSSGGGVAIGVEELRYEVLVNWLSGGVSIHDASGPSTR